MTIRAFVLSVTLIELVATVGFASAQLDDCGTPPARALAAPDPAYHTDIEIATELLAIERAFPAIARRVDLPTTYGTPRTHGNRTIHALKISDNVGLDEDEPAVLIVSNHHSNELITPEIALDLAKRLTSGYGQNAAITARVDGWAIWIVPTMNPDGLAHVWAADPTWRKNRRNNGGGSYGVDLNRNYPVHYGLCGASTSSISSTYQGPGPLSEPETQTMVAFARAERFAKVLDFHSHGRDVRKPYGCNLCLPQPLCAYYVSVQQTLASLASYRPNSSCCGGGHFAFQTADNGALAFLVETGTTFQPPYATALAEVVRVRPMIDHWLDMPLPLSGHVTNALTNEPIEASIDVGGIAYQYGERRRSEPAHGRYHYFLPPGQYSVTFRAVGYLPATRPVTVTANGTVLDVAMQPSASLTRVGTPRVGGSFALDIASPGDEGQLYLVGAAFSPTPPQTLLGRVVPLAYDALFVTALSNAAVFQRMIGLLDGAAAGRATVQVPAIPQLVGVSLWFAVATADPTPAIRSVSAPLRVPLQS